MVMSPVDIAAPDLKRFPKFTEAKRLSCVLNPGDVLFMPAFWWHEVQSYPDVVQRRNLAINYWSVRHALVCLCVFKCLCVYVCVCPTW